MTPTRWILLVLTLVVLTVAALFTVQNSGRTTDLSLDLYFWAVHLKQDVAVPYLLWGTLGSGLLLGGILGRLSGRSSSRVDSFASTSGGGSYGGSGSRSDDDWT